MPIAQKPLQPPMFANPPSWMGIPQGLPQRRSRAAVLGVPFDCGTHSTRIGSRLGPAAIREQSSNLRRIDPRTNIDLVAALGLVDAGDVALTPSLIEQSFARIEAAVDAILSRGAVAVTMGGDGAVTLPQVRALKRHAREICVVHIDAHTDAYPIEGYNTATTFRHVAEEGLVDLKRSFHIGARGPTMVPGVFEYARKLGYRLVTMPDLRKRGYKQVAAEVLRTVGRRPVYLCFDMDFFDPATAPGVCTPTWGGATSDEGLAFLEMLAPLDVRVLDVNTVSPPHDSAGTTAFLAGMVQWTFLQSLARKMARR
jgi:agmatinase